MRAMGYFGIIRYTKKQFAFLKKYGFKKKMYTEYTNFEIYYEKQNVAIGLIYYLRIPDSAYKKWNSNIDVLLADASYEFMVTIQQNKKSVDIFDSEIFDAKLRSKLKANVHQVIKSDMPTAISLYANFLKDNMDIINNL